LILVAAAIFVSSSWIIRLLFKSDFMPAAHFLKLLSSALVLTGLNHAQMQFLIALNRERSLLIGALLVCAANLLLAILLLPRYGVPGSCYALLGSEFIYFIYLRRTIHAEP
jgi:O-antigen/teichoic acid export membrane protein